LDLAMVREVLTHASYVMDQLLRGFVVVVCLLAAFQSFATIASLPYVENLKMGSVITFIGMLAYVTFQMTSLVEELGRGEAMLYLAHGLTKRCYLASWILILCVVPIVVFVLSIVVPIAIIAPSLLNNVEIPTLIAYTVLHLATFSSILFLLALSKRRGLVVALGMAMTFLLPIALSLATYYFTSLAPILGIVCPYYYYLTYETSSKLRICPSPPSIGLASLVLTMILIYACFVKVKKLDV